jgi:sensor histidine kinase regulating citrate/malate metabolism
VTVERDGDAYELRVADEGPGFGEIDRAALARGEETQLEHSSGLGLWLVRWTVTSSGGTLSIEEREPRGTVVTVGLPAAE